MPNDVEVLARREILFIVQGERQPKGETVDPTITVAEFAAIAARGAGLEDLEVFLEDADEPLDGELVLIEQLSAVFAPLHIARHRTKIAVTVEYNGRTVEREFRPSATIEKITRWAIGPDGLQLEGILLITSSSMTARYCRRRRISARSITRIIGSSSTWFSRPSPRAMQADETALRRDLAAPPFKIGVRRGKWALKGIAFPYVLLFIAAPSRPGGPAGFLLRSECSGYSGTAPTSQLWHGGNNQPLALPHRPHGPEGILIAFKDWGSCLYHPVDRLAAAHWPDTYNEKKWTADKDITLLTGNCSCSLRLFGVYGR